MKTDMRRIKKEKEWKKVQKSSEEGEGEETDETACGKSFVSTRDITYLRCFSSQGYERGFVLRNGSRNNCLKWLPR